MNYKKIVFVAVIILSTLIVTVPAAASDELYYSASNCKPIEAGHTNGSGAEGLEWFRGRWLNFDRDDVQILVCPVPYKRKPNNLQMVSVRAVVSDLNPHTFTTAILCRQGANGNVNACDAKDSFPSQLGTSTISLSVQPTNNTRFIFLEIHVPDDDSNGTSGFIGYRVFRN